MAVVAANHSSSSKPHRNAATRLCSAFLPNSIRLHRISVFVINQTKVSSGSGSTSDVSRNTTSASFDRNCACVSRTERGSGLTSAMYSGKSFSSELSILAIRSWISARRASSLCYRLNGLALDQVGQRSIQKSLTCLPVGNQILTRSYKLCKLIITLNLTRGHLACTRFG